MKKSFPFVVFALTLALCLAGGAVKAEAIGIEAAIGGWNQTPSGFLAYDAGGVAGGEFDMDQQFGFEDEMRLMGRLKVDMPLMIPNLYVMATPMSFEGSKDLGVGGINFGGTSFTGVVDSKLVLDHYDIALYYGIPLLEGVTLDTLNIEFGLNAKIIDLQAEIESASLAAKESKSVTIPLPMLYVGVQVRPTDSISFEAEGRAISMSGNHFYDVLGRFKYSMGPAFLGLGYRYEDILIDEEGIKAEITFGGPFVEAGIEI
jgi:outer membrane protein